MTRVPFLVREFDPVVEAQRDRRTSFTEEEALGARFWSVGDDAALREDLRFRHTWEDRWILAEHLLANDIVYEQLHARGGGVLPLPDQFVAWDQTYDAHTVLCPRDPRLVVRSDGVRLAASEFGDRPRLVDASPLEQWVTHLPFYSLRAVAASMPSGGWDGRALDEQVPQLLGWLKVDLPRGGDRRLFVARIDGQSMNDGVNALRDGSLAVFRAGAVDLDAQPTVVVRGAYRDPDTAGYVLKRLVRSRGRVRLVSANPDHTRYPDIELDPTRAAELSVVAELLRPLAAESYERELRAKRSPGTRPLESREHRAKVLERLEATLDRVFGPPPAPPDAPPEALWNRWSATLCLDDAGLGVRLSALEGLPGDAGMVSVMGAPATSAQRPSNARLHPSLIRVPPQTGPYVTTVEGLSGPAAEALAACAVRGLDEARASVFVRRGDRHWFRRDTPRVRAGETLRLVIGPALSLDKIGDRSPFPLGGGWSQVEWSLPDEPSTEDRSVLEVLGVALEAAPLALRFSGRVPRRITLGARGEEIARWQPGDAVQVRVTATKVGAASREACLYALGPRGVTSIALTGTPPWSVTLSALLPGRYALRVEARESAVPPDECFFEVHEQVDGAWPRAEATLAGVAPNAPADLAVALESARLRTPPFWPLRGRWDQGTVMHLTPLRANEIGEVDLTPWRAVLAGTLSTTRIAKLTLHANPLQTWTLQHRRTPSPESVRAALATIWAQIGDAVQAAAAMPAMLFDPWLRPALRELGWSVPPRGTPPSRTTISRRLGSAPRRGARGTHRAADAPMGTGSLVRPRGSTLRGWNFRSLCQ
ncbi:MAG: S24 family peptidase [Polyangiales bacterium]